MKALHILALILVAVAFEAHAARPKEQPTTSYNFDYQVAGADAVGIKRVFDDGKNTVLILDGSDQLPTVTTTDGTPLPIKRVDNYAVLPGLQSDVLVYAHGTVAHVVEGNQTPAPVVAPPTIPTQATIAMVPHPPAPAGSAGTVAAPTPSTGLVPSHPVTITSTTPAAASVTTTPLQHPTQPEPLPAWRVSAGSTLRAVLKAWAAQAGWQEPQWPHSLDNSEYPIPNALTFYGSFQDVVRDLMAPYKKGSPPLRADLYPQERQVLISENQ